MTSDTDQNTKCELWRFEELKAWTLIAPPHQLEGISQRVGAELWAVNLVKMGFNSYDLTFVMCDGSRKGAGFSAGSDAYALERAVSTVERVLSAIRVGQPWDLDELRRIPGMPISAPL